MAREQGTFGASKLYLDRRNIVPKFTKSQETEFTTWRERLATRPGLVIANHPGYLDSPALLSQINRKDLKIIAHRRHIDKWQMFGEEMILPAAKSPGELRKTLEATNDHIKAGGLVLLYPTGGQSRPDKANRGFQSAFRSIVQRLRPSDMIYSFYINPADASELLAKLPEKTENRLAEPGEIKIDEAYTEASEWQEIIRTSARDNVNDNLTRHFLQKFNRERFD